MGRQIEELAQFGTGQHQIIGKAHDMLQPPDEHGGKADEGDDFADSGEALHMQPGAEHKNAEDGERGSGARGCRL